MSMRLRILLGDHPQTAALKSGAIKSDLVEFDFADYTPTNKGFKPMVREQAFDVSEMAIVTYLMAKGYNKPMVLLPTVVMARFQHGYAVYNPALGQLKPADLAGKRVGIRSFTTTTGAWLRGILANDYGVDLNAIQWVTFEDPHVAEYVDSTTRAPAGRPILQMLFDGELDAVLGEKCDDPRVSQLFPDLASEQKAWFEKHQVVPVNHMVVVSRQLSETRPDVVREVFRMLKASREAAPVTGKFGLDPFSHDNMVRSLKLITDYAAEQQLLPRPVSVDELFDDVTRGLR
jgi:4,5-dihydroxyphthalate decarboxylase